MTNFSFFLKKGKFSWDLWNKEPVKDTKWDKGEPKKEGVFVC